MKTVLFGKKSSKSNISKDASLDKKTSITLNTQSNDLVVDSTVISTPVCHVSNINGEQSQLEKSSSANLLNATNDDDLIRLEQAATKAQAAFRGYLVRLMHITRTLQETTIYFTPLTNIGAFKPSCNILVTLNDVKTRKLVPLKKDNGQISMVPLFQSQESIAGVISVDPMQGKKVEHNDIKIELLGQIEIYFDRGNFYDFTSLGNMITTSVNDFRKTNRIIIFIPLVDASVARVEGFQLAKRLSVFDLIVIGVGATIGAGVYTLVGTVAKEQTGPAITISFLIAGIVAGLLALCYAELACRCPSAGSAYHYSYLCVVEGVAWLIGWSLILEYTLGGAAVARGISPNTAVFFGCPDKLPAFLTRPTVLGIVVDPCATILVFIITGLLCTGIKESSLAQGIITTINVVALLFIIVVGGYIGFKTQWVGYKVPGGYFLYGANGVLVGSATVKNPQRDLPIGIGVSLFTCCVLYMLVSVVVIGLVPCSKLDPDTLSPLLLLVME
ncbi:unnamed protein product [Lactuca virosa]|uniref:Uncharacterized protein n=1 Tax=Lactuca virosa TaxID=75947 RepID=A0AAU9PKR0_9ASTR|nr:unnamed protein product [Lactuca virosa]